MGQEAVNTRSIRLNFQPYSSDTYDFLPRSSFRVFLLRGQIPTESFKLILVTR